MVKDKAPNPGWGEAILERRSNLQFLTFFSNYVALRINHDTWSRFPFNTSNKWLHPMTFPFPHILWDIYPMPISNIQYIYMYISPLSNTYPIYPHYGYIMAPLLWSVARRGGGLSLGCRWPRTRGTLGTLSDGVQSKNHGKCHFLKWETMFRKDIVLWYFMFSHENIDDVCLSFKIGYFPIAMLDIYLSLDYVGNMYLKTESPNDGSDTPTGGLIFDSDGKQPNQNSTFCRPLSVFHFSCSRIFHGSRVTHQSAPRHWVNPPVYCKSKDHSSHAPIPQLNFKIHVIFEIFIIIIIIIKLLSSASDYYHHHHHHDFHDEITSGTLKSPQLWPFGAVSPVGQGSVSVGSRSSHGSAVPPGIRHLGNRSKKTERNPSYPVFQELSTNYQITMRMTDLPGMIVI